MTKWADYLISAVRYVETATTKHISKVEVRIDNGESVGTPSIWSREDVIKSLDLNMTFMTILKGSDNKWQQGASVGKIYEHDAWYIKTKKDNTKKDNLGSLPEF